MDVSLNKLKALWNKLNETKDHQDVKTLFKRIHADQSIVTYAEEKLNNLENILTYKLPDKLRDSEFTAVALGCAVGIDEGGSDTVYRLLIENSTNLGLNDERLKCRELVWGKLSAIKSDREDRFRVCSNASGLSAKETFNTTVVMLNPDPWLYSYNFPWHIISWIQDVHNKRKPSYSLRYDNNREDVLDKKFIYKYLWMLATYDVVPILSLRSFLNLRPFFKEIQPEFSQTFALPDGNSGTWELSFDDFKTKWTFLSKRIVETIAGTQDLTKELRERLAIFLMVVSLADKPVQDLGTMIEKGNKAAILYGPPGTGKTYSALEYVFSTLGIERTKADECKKEEYGLVLYCSPTGLGEVTIVQFHPNYSYQDFVGGIFPGVDKSDKTKLFYEEREGVFKKICDRANTAKKAGENKKFFLLIDEINRADLSSVFGELMYGLEYRGFSMHIPTFGEFTIPDNVYVIGTMNNTDKSLIGFDIALRRRFAFIKIEPDMDVLEHLSLTTEEEEKGKVETDKQDVVSIFAQRARDLNRHLKEVLRLPAEKQIGHAYFLRIKDFCERREIDKEQVEYILTPYALEQLWTYHIVPLLEEYLGIEYEEHQSEIDRFRTDFCDDF